MSEDTGYEWERDCQIHEEAFAPFEWMYCSLGDLDRTRESVDALLDGAQCLHLIIQNATACRIRAFGEPTGASLWPFQQPGFDDGITQGPDIHLEYDFVFEFPPRVIIDHHAASVARRHAARDEGRVVQALSE